MEVSVVCPILHLKKHFGIKYICPCTRRVLGHIYANIFFSVKRVFFSHLRMSQSSSEWYYPLILLMQYTYICQELQKQLNIWWIKELRTSSECKYCMSTFLFSWKMGSRGSVVSKEGRVVIMSQIQWSKVAKLLWSDLVSAFWAITRMEKIQYSLTLTLCCHGWGMFWHVTRSHPVTKHVVFHVFFFFHPPSSKYPDSDLIKF